MSKKVSARYPQQLTRIRMSLAVAAKAAAPAAVNNVDVGPRAIKWGVVPQTLLSDCVLVIETDAGEIRMYAHRAVLALHSPVFLAMFCEPLNARSTGAAERSPHQEIAVRGFKRSAIWALLDAMYERPNRAELAAHLSATTNRDVMDDLLAAASFYQVTFVLDALGDWFHSGYAKQSGDSFWLVEALCRADRYMLGELRAACLYSLEHHHLQLDGIGIVCRPLDPATALELVQNAAKTQPIFRLYRFAVDWCEGRPDQEARMVDLFYSLPWSLCRVQKDARQLFADAQASSGLSMDARMFVFEKLLQAFL